MLIECLRKVLFEGRENSLQHTCVVLARARHCELALNVGYFASQSLKAMAPREIDGRYIGFAAHLLALRI